MNSIMQEWAANLGLRHQGVLVAAVRGCDGALREDTCKWISRFYRGCLLRAHCSDVRKASSFMIWCDSEKEFWEHANEVLKSYDHYPNHFLMHLLHAVEITGYYHSNLEVRKWWHEFYLRLVKKLHLYPESKEQLDARLGADEETFKRQQHA